MSKDVKLGGAARWGEYRAADKNLVVWRCLGLKTAATIPVLSSHGTEYLWCKTGKLWRVKPYMLTWHASLCILFLQTLVQLRKRRTSRWRASGFLWVCRGDKLRWMRWVVLIIRGKLSQRIPQASIQALYKFDTVEYLKNHVQRFNAMQDENWWYIVTQ